MAMMMIMVMVIGMIDPWSGCWLSRCVVTHTVEACLFDDGRCYDDGDDSSYRDDECYSDDVMVILLMMRVMVIMRMHVAHPLVRELAQCMHGPPLLHLYDDDDGDDDGCFHSS